MKEHRERVSAFRVPGIKGWAYALAHKEAAVDLILKTYSTKKSREALLFEADRTEMLVGRSPGHIGEQDAARKAGDVSPRPIAKLWATERRYAARGD